MFARWTFSTLANCNTHVVDFFVPLYFDSHLFCAACRCDVKLIDFGSSCFTTDTLTTYIQSRSYRAPEVRADVKQSKSSIHMNLPSLTPSTREYPSACEAQPSFVARQCVRWHKSDWAALCISPSPSHPLTPSKYFPRHQPTYPSFLCCLRLPVFCLRTCQVILGIHYDQRIDIWSLGCILVELFTAKVLFQNDTVQAMLVRIQSVIGDFPEWMRHEGKEADKYFTTKGVVYEETDDRNFLLLNPIPSNLQRRLAAAKDPGFVSFIRYLLTIDPNIRPTAKQALQHPWLQGDTAVEHFTLPQ